MTSCIRTISLLRIRLEMAAVVITRGPRSGGDGFPSIGAPHGQDQRGR
jgi:hypothetical protein